MKSVVQHEPESSNAAVPRLPDSTRIDHAHFRVSDVSKALVFYRDLLGLHDTRSDGGTTILSALGGEDPLVLVTEDRLAEPRPVRSTGLFHLAFLFATRRDLAAAFKRLHEHRWPFQGFADHGVSEALYLADPDGNGIELYADRPRAQWPYRNGQLEMVTNQLDIHGLLSELEGPIGKADRRNSGMTIGHIHLQISDLALAEGFYHRVLGFDITQRNYPGALFLSAGGYHHHIGVNTWNSRGASPAPARSLGLVGFGIRLGDKDSARSLSQRIRQTSYWTKESGDTFYLHDADNIQIEVS